MNLIPSWLSSLRSRRDLHVADTDLADMGTTFALEAAMPGSTNYPGTSCRAGTPRTRSPRWQDRPTRPARL